jgi:DNA-binding transcriptional LysR family regulator
LLIFPNLGLQGSVLNLNQLKIFYLAAKHGNLTAAAKDLYITQPAVTRGIQRLQEYYEIKFFKRLGRKLELTYSGKGLYEIAEKIFELEGIAEDYIRDFQNHKRGYLRIDASETFGTHYLPFIIDCFSRLNPRLQITINTLANKEVVQRTVERANDLGFISFPVEHPKLVLQTILEEDLVIIVPPDHDFAKKDHLKPTDLEGQSVIMHEKGSVFHKIIDDLIRENNISLSKYIEFSNNVAVKQAVEAGTGIALISRKAAGEEIKSGKLNAIPLDDESARRQFYLIYRSDKIISEPVQRLMETVYHWAEEYSKISS